MNSSTPRKWLRWLPLAISIAGILATPLLAQTPTQDPPQDQKPKQTLAQAQTATQVQTQTQAQNQTQTTPAPQEQQSAPETAEVVITGSRIPVPANINATSPITAVSSQEIELEGRTDVSELLNQLPQNVIGANADFGNNTNPLTNAGGTTTADLRGLGPQRTLVLVDGKRLYIGDPTPYNNNPAADLDQIPAAMIERVDVVTGGASATYGSDAIAGVVNFITKKDFQGIEIGGQYGFFQHSNHEDGLQALEDAKQSIIGSTNPPFTAPSGSLTDGDKRDLSIVMGTNVADGAGNITAYLTYHMQDPVSAADRDFTHCQLVTNATNTGYNCIGTSNSNYFAPANGPNAGQVFSVVGNQLLPYPQVGSSPPSQYNPNPFLYQQRQDTRYNAGFNAHLDINDYVKPYAIFAFMDDRTNEAAGPSAAFKNSYPFSPDNLYRTNCSNPLLSAQERAILCTSAMIAADTASPGSAAGLAIFNLGRRNIEGGPRQFYWDHTNYRVALGSTGDIVKGFTYDAYAQYYYVSYFNSTGNSLNNTSIGNALIATTGATGNPVCVSSAGGCVPWNLWTQGGVTPAQLAYLQTPATAYATDSETTMHADITGELGEYSVISPMAHDGVGINLGAEHRGDTYDFSPDDVVMEGDLAGNGPIAPLHAGDSVNEGFMEVRVPIIQDRPWVHDLDFDGGYRYSNYSTAGHTNTYKFEVQLAPTEDFRFRGSYDYAVRAPNLFELYSSETYGQSALLGVDPCAGVATVSFTECARTGVTQTQYNAHSIPQCTAGQCGQVTGGNPALKPEQAETYSVGVTFTPTMLPNLSGSIDYWHIEQFGLIGSAPAPLLLGQCLNTGDAFSCSQVVRNPVTGALTGATVAGGGYVLQNDINTGSGLTSGIDVQGNYRQPLGGLGALVASMNGTYLEHSITTPYQGSTSYDCAGLFGATCNNQSVNPRWRHTVRLSWETPWDKLMMSINWRFIGATDFDYNSANPLLHDKESIGGQGNYDSINARIPNYNYFDLAVEWPFARDMSVRAGVNNVLDKDPPIIPTDITGTGSANTYPTYDILGREVFFAFTAKF